MLPSSILTTYWYRKPSGLRLYMIDLSIFHGPVCRT